MKQIESNPTNRPLWTGTTLLFPDWFAEKMGDEMSLFLEALKAEEGGREFYEWYQYYDYFWELFLPLFKSKDFGNVVAGSIIFSVRGVDWFEISKR